MDFERLVEKLAFLYIVDTMDKTPEEVSECIRKYIRGNGWDCMDETLDEEEEAKEWFAENHPDLFKNKEIDSSRVTEIDFLCDNCGYITGYDIDWHTFHISFWGEWGKVGIFSVSI